MTNDVIKIGEYIIIQKQNFRKLHKLNKPNSTITVGRDIINLGGVEGCPYFSVFKMIPKSKKGRECRLELTDEAIQLKDEIDIKTSGADNRNIVDDGQSQKLSKEEIEELTSDANKASQIVESLISNSNTFQNKTEFSQEKYLKKKEKKYSEYLQILKPNLRMISDIMYKLDADKIQNLRIDTLSQIITQSNVHCEGNHLLYDSGSNGLLAAALLSAIGHNTNGKLVHMHPGNMSQKQALLAMNFSDELLNRCISVNIYSVLRLIYQGNENHIEENSDSNSSEVNTLKRKVDDDAVEPETKVAKHEDSEGVANQDSVLAENGSNKHLESEENTSKRKVDNTVHVEPEPKVSKNEKSQEVSNQKSVIAENSNNTHLESEVNTSKRKVEDDAVEPEPKAARHEDSQEEANQDFVNTENGSNRHLEPKKPKWHYENISASELLTSKMDSLVIACKEDPENIFLELLQFIKPGRPFVIYYPVAEPLQSLYMVLKSHVNVGLLKLTCNWMRYYQVLPERTHPEVTMNMDSGYLLTGYILQ